MKKYHIDRIISIATLIASLVAIVLVLKRPAPVAQKQAPAKVAEHAQSFDQKMAQFEQQTQQAQSGPSTASQSATSDSGPVQNPKAEVRVNSDEISAVLAQSLGNVGTAEGIN